MEEMRGKPASTAWLSQSCASPLWFLKYSTEPTKPATTSSFVFEPLTKAFTQLLTSAGVGGSPTRSKETRRIKVRRSAAGLGVIPFASNAAKRK